MNLSARSEGNLHGVHPDLARVIRETPLIAECSRIEIVEGGDGDEDFVKAAFPLYEKLWKLFEQTGKRLGVALESHW